MVGVMGVFNNYIMLMIIVVIFLVIVVFSFIILFVEFDVSNRVLVWLDSSGVLGGVEYDGVKDVFKWVVMIYVVVVLFVFVILLYFLMKLLVVRRR